MIYGDPLEDTTRARVPDILAIRQSGNLYAYCIDNPISYKDSYGCSTASATEMIRHGVNVFSQYAQPDGPYPFGEILGAVYLLGCLTYAGGVAIKAVYTSTKDEESTTTIVAENTKSEPNDIIIYRYYA